MGILNDEHYQIIYSDTPGILEPKYALHKAMMNFVKVSLEDADLVMVLVEPEDADELIQQRVAHLKAPLLLVINKIDLVEAGKREAVVHAWKERIPFAKEVIAVSAHTGENTEGLTEMITSLLPEHPPYFPVGDEVSDRPLRFFISEIIREKIFLNYKDEVPYSTEVMITSFKEADDIIRISAEIFCERDSQKAILIGKQGTAIKQLGIDARRDIELFLDKKVFLETRVKVAANWRKVEGKLKGFGYTG